MTDKNRYENQNLPNGAKNPKYVDLLEEDKPIAGQKFTCVSFVSPEKILKKKEIFFTLVCIMILSHYTHISTIGLI